MRNFTLKILLISLFPLLLLAQLQNKIESKNSELNTLRSDINKLEKDLTNITAKEKSNIKILKKFDKQKLLLGKSIKNLEREEKKKENTIKVLKKRRKELEKRISKLQKEYGDYLVWLYKEGDSSTLNYLFNAESFNQALIRYKHLDYVHRENENTVEGLRSSKEELKSNIAKVEIEVNEKEKIINQKLSEQKILVKRRNEKKSILKNLKKNKHNVVIEIDEKRKMEIAIKQIISDLIVKARERERKYRTDKLKGNIENYKDYFNYSSFENFAQLKGVLNWPLNNASIDRKFGENKNDKTKTITLNYGIDLIAKDKKEVYAVAEGIVSAIEWIAGYGSVVIITHRDNFRTVYGHITDINVLEGNKVVAGDLIGIVNESLEGNILHFEIWNERINQNPQDWLVRK